MKSKSSNLLQALERVKDNKLEDFIAPLPEGTIDLLSVQNGIPYWFQITNETPGWYTLKPAVERSVDMLGARGSSTFKLAHPIGQPQPFEIEDYLNQLPHFNVIALYPVSLGSWLCVPHSVGDTKQRGWDGKPKVFTLCNENIEPLDVVRVANLAGALIYHEVSKLVMEGLSHKLLLEAANYSGKSMAHIGAKISNVDWKRAWNLVVERLDQLRVIHQKDDLESQFKLALEFVGAGLHSFQENSDGTFEIKYTDPVDGKIIPLKKVDKNLRIQSAGICLSGTDRQHNLSSIVEVMHDARKLRRFDLNESYYL